MEDGTAVAKMKKFPTAGTAYTFTAGITTSTGIITLEMTDTVTTDIPAGDITTISYSPSLMLIKLEFNQAWHS